MTSISNGPSSICKECTKFKSRIIDKDCDICVVLEFGESILCDLNRRSQGLKDFKCRGFRPALKLVGGSKCQPIKGSCESSRRHERDSFP